MIETRKIVFGGLLNSSYFIGGPLSEGFFLVFCAQCSKKICLFVFAGELGDFVFGFMFTFCGVVGGEGIGVVGDREIGVVGGEEIGGCGRFG